MARLLLHLPNTTNAAGVRLIVVRSPAAGRSVTFWRRLTSVTVAPSDPQATEHDADCPILCRHPHYIHTEDNVTAVDDAGKLVAQVLVVVDEESHLREWILHIVLSGKPAGEGGLCGGIGLTLGFDHLALDA